MKRVDTAIISENSFKRQFLHNRGLAIGGTATLNSQKAVTVIVRGMIETVWLSPGIPAHIGRFHLENTQAVDLDLTPYGADQYGVSRVHARLDVNNYDHLSITDLGSTNGTIVAGQRLKPYDPVIVRDGDEIVVGNLLLRVCFASSRELI